MVTFFKLICFWLLFMSSVPSSAQDTIFTIAKKKIISRIVEIDDKKVFYKQYKNLSGPTYRINRDELIKIVYSNGVTDTFNQRLARIPEPVEIILIPLPDPDVRTRDYFRNFVYTSATDLFTGVFTLGYERINNTGKVSYKIPLSFGLASIGLTKQHYDNSSFMNYALPAGAHYYTNKVVSSGLEINAYPKGQGSVRYFVGPAFEYGWYNYYMYQANKNDPGTWSFEKKTSQLLTVMIKNGVLVQHSKKFNFMIYLGAGTYNLLSEEGSVSGDNYYYSLSLLEYLNFELGASAGIKF